MAYINSTRTVVNNVGTDIALAGAGNLFTVSGSLGGTKSLTLSDGFINNGAPEANLIVPLLFPNGHNDLGPSLYLEITVAGVTNPIPVVSNQNGTLAPIPHYEMIEGGSTVYKVVDPNTILNVYYTADYDGSQNPAFVVVGNPLVLSSSTYSIYANGHYELLKPSTTEQWTGRYALSGKKIYQRCFPFANKYVPSEQLLTSELNASNIDELIRADLIWTKGASSYATKNYSYVIINPNSIGITTMQSAFTTGQDSYVIIEWTKVSS